MRTSRDETIARPGPGEPGRFELAETLQSLLIAFALAFVFRSFIVEPFVIPTGSMAPTLRGAHLLALSPETGYSFAVGPRDLLGATSTAAPVQGSDQAGGPIIVRDPMLLDESRPLRGSAGQVTFRNARTRMGDRILVLKYLYILFEPKRFDVVVFKNPTRPTENYIKRLIGLPGEIIWLADGDVFARLAKSNEPFRVQRKPVHVQKRAWQPIYHSQEIPLRPDNIVPQWRPPWSGEDWDTEGRSYRKTTAQPTDLTFRSAPELGPPRHSLRRIEDWYAYNQSRERSYQYFAVSDIRLAGGIQPDDSGLESIISLTCREHEFQAVIDASGRASLRMRPLDAADTWTTLDETTVEPLPTGVVTNVEFWHVDQSLRLFVNGREVLYGEYDWDADRRLLHATGMSASQLLEQEGPESGGEGNAYARRYGPREPIIRWRFSGSTLTLHRVELDRDLYYQPSENRDFDYRAALATHPNFLPTLTDDEYFVCGDNSPDSLDGRLWGYPDPWIAAEFDDAEGVIPRELMLGKAFFVYFPSPEGVSERMIRLAPNFGEMRFIH